jgi:curved DNA-binding protein CbpA
MRQPKRSDLYQRLGVSSSATPEQIKAAYRAAIRKVHPDMNQGRADTTRKAQDLNEAYEVLIDPSARAAYDHARARRPKRARRRPRRPAPVRPPAAVRPPPVDEGPFGQVLLRLGMLAVERYFALHGLPFADEEPWAS